MTVAWIPHWCKWLQRGNICVDARWWRWAMSCSVGVLVGHWIGASEFSQVRLFDYVSGRNWLPPREMATRARRMVQKHPRCVVWKQGARNTIGLPTWRNLGTAVFKMPHQRSLVQDSQEETGVPSAPSNAAFQPSENIDRTCELVNCVQFLDCLFKERKKDRLFTALCTTKWLLRSWSWPTTTSV